MKVIISIFLGLLIGVSGKPTIKIITGLLDDIIHTVSPKASQKQVPLTYQQSVPYIPNGPSVAYTNDNINDNPYQPAFYTPYPTVNPYYNPYNVQTGSYSLTMTTEHYPNTVLDKQSTEMYPPSGPAGIYDNIIFVQDPPIEDIKEPNEFMIDVRNSI